MTTSMCDIRRSIRYRRSVRFGDHRLMLRPRDSHDLRLIRTNLNFLPAASVSWIHDVFGNSIAIASFAESAAELRIESKLQTYVVERPRSEIAPEAARTICLVLAAIPEVADIVLAAGGAVRTLPPRP